MHILGLLAAAIGVVVVILWRMQQAASAARDIADAANDTRGLLRGWLWRRKAITNPLDAVDDPREAAVALMAVVAGFDGAMSERERAVIEEQARTRFGATPSQAVELLARARWLVKDSADPAEVMRRLAPVIRKRLNAAEQAELIAMLEAVASAEGRQDESLKLDIQRFARSLGR